MFTFFLFIFFPLEACMPLSASPTSGPDWKDPNLWRSGRCDSGVLSVLCKVLSAVGEDIMKDVLPDMSKGYSDKLESKA